MSISKNLEKFFLRHFALIPSSIVLIFYLITLAPGLIAPDSGELATVQYTLGITHPTGYPLFTILGFLFSHIPVPIKPIIKLNFLTALWSVLTIYVLTITTKKILDDYKFWLNDSYQQNEDVVKRFELSETIKIFSAVFGGLLLGFSRTFWLQSLSVEVYSFHMFLFSLTFYFLLQSIKEDHDEIKTSLTKSNWIFTFIFLGLGFSNHLSTLFIVPAVLYGYFLKLNFSAERIKRFFIYTVVGSLVTIILYLYLPIRAAMQPVINWGNPVDFKSLIDHVSGRLYHQFLFPSFSDYLSKVGFFLNSLMISFDKSQISGSEFSSGILISLLGMVILFFLMRKLFNVSIIIFLTTVLISSFYNIPDIDTYFLPAYFVLAISASVGLFYLFSIRLNQIKKIIVISFIVLLILFFEINLNYSRVDLSDNDLLDQFTLELLNTGEPNSIVISVRSNFYFPSLYYQFVENVRQDIAVVEHYLLQNKWYYYQLNRIHPEIITLQDSVVNLNLKNRNVYFSAEMLEKVLRGEVKLPDDLHLVPHYFMFKLVPKKKYEPLEFKDYSFRYPQRSNFYTDEVKNIIRNMLLNRSIYERMNGKVELARLYLKKLKKDFPEYKLPRDLDSLIAY